MNNQNTQEKTKNRYLFLDVYRGLAIILMIIYHFSYDMYLNRFWKIPIHSNFWWKAFPKLIVFLFLTAVGMSLVITHAEKIRWDIVKKRFFKIFGYALIITAVTFVLFPKRFVYFGTLHCISFCILFGVFFLKKSWAKYNLLLGLAIVIPNIIWPHKLINISKMFGIKSMDYIPLYPWFGVLLIGIFLGHQKFYELKIPTNKITQGMAYLGRHSLFIYLIHQPILFGVISGVRVVLKNLT